MEPLRVDSAEELRFWEQVYCAALIGNVTADISEIADAARRAWRLRFVQGPKDGNNA